MCVIWIVLGKPHKNGQQLILSTLVVDILMLSCGVCDPFVVVSDQFNSQRWLG